MNELTASYRSVNESFRPRLVWHAGIDAGFFTEYTYMLHAMLVALHRGRQFRLYTADANFAFSRGWTDYFQPFCEEETASLHHAYNRHGLPSWPALVRRNPSRSPFGLLKWKLKSEGVSLFGHLKALGKYRQWVCLNSDVDFRFERSYPVPAWGLGDDYLRSFRRLVDVTWHFNAEVEAEVEQLTQGLHLPADYMGCQVRGGDKVTEVSLTSPDAIVDTLRRVGRPADVFVLTDDYRLYEYLVAHHPDIRWYTLCTPAEQGYVNRFFTETAPAQKRRQMIRFLASMRLLMGCRHFVGSITPGPSLFLLKYLWPHATPQDCAPEDFPRAYTLPIVGRGKMAQAYLESQASDRYTHKR